MNFVDASREENQKAVQWAMFTLVSLVLAKLLHPGHILYIRQKKKYCSPLDFLFFTLLWQITSFPWLRLMSQLPRFTCLIICRFRKVKLFLKAGCLYSLSVWLWSCFWRFSFFRCVCVGPAQGCGWCGHLGFDVLQAEYEALVCGSMEAKKPRVGVMLCGTGRSWAIIMMIMIPWSPWLGWWWLWCQWLRGWLAGRVWSTWVTYWQARGST